MDDSFRVRVDKVFGSLMPTSSSSLRSLWSLTDEEVEKKEWNRERENPDRDENPCSSSFEGFFSNQRKIAKKKHNLLDDDDLDEDEPQGTGSSQFGDKDGVEEEIRSSIGLDCTLDNEEEEDVHDKVALGRENAGERLYMKDITDYGTYLNSHNILPETFNDHARDTRANLLAARNRLKEDEIESGALDSSEDVGKKVSAVVDSILTEDGTNLKSILKRTETQSESRSQKRVRFDPACKEACEEELEKAQDSSMVKVEADTNAEDTRLFSQDTRQVPDFVRNPSKYTKYSFDLSTEVDEKSNRQAFMDFLNMVKTSSSAGSQPEGPSADLPKSVKFIPKKKAAGEAVTEKGISNMDQSPDAARKDSSWVVLAPGIAAAETQEDEVCAMEEDDPVANTENKSGITPRTGRRYRSNVRLDDSDG